MPFSKTEAFDLEYMRGVVVLSPKGPNLLLYIFPMHASDYWTIWMNYSS